MKGMLLLDQNQSVAHVAVCLGGSKKIEADCTVSELAAHLSNFCLTNCHMLVSKIKPCMSQSKPH
jgi:hypothetical protein